MVIEEEKKPEALDPDKMSSAQIETEILNMGEKIDYQTSCVQLVEDKDLKLSKEASELRKQIIDIENDRKEFKLNIKKGDSTIAKFKRERWDMINIFKWRAIKREKAY